MGAGGGGGATRRTISRGAITYMALSIGVFLSPVEWVVAMGFGPGVSVYYLVSLNYF